MTFRREERKFVVFEKLDKCRGKSKQTIHQKRRQLSNKLKWNSNEKIYKRQFEWRGWWQKGGGKELERGWGGERLWKKEADAWWASSLQLRKDKLTRWCRQMHSDLLDLSDALARNRRRHKSLWLTAADHDSGYGMLDVGWWPVDGGGVGCVLLPLLLPATKLI